MMPGAESSAESIAIRGLAASGAGVGRLADGQAVFVHRTAPGDHVRVQVTERRRRWARGRLLAIERPAAARRLPPCRFYGTCGGCTLQHLLYPHQLAGKRDRVADTLRRIGGLRIDVDAVHAAPRSFRYRSRATFHLRRERRGRVRAGFHRLEEAGRIEDVDGRCLVLDERVADAWDALRAGWGPGAERLPSGHELDLKLQAVQDGVVLSIRGGHGDGDPSALMAHAPSIVSVWRERARGRIRWLAGSRTVQATRAGYTFTLRAGSFLQVNEAAADVLFRDVLEAAGPIEPGMHVVDAYAGAGLYGRALAEAGARVTAIELIPPSPTDPTPEGLTRLTATVEAVLGPVLPAALVILNPPRTGVAEQALDALRARPPGRVLYVSCDPATLARDLERLAGALRPTRVAVYDLFPQTPHVETLVTLVPESPDG